MTSRSGEVVAMGSVKKAAYQASGDQVLVTYLEGPTKGKTFKYVIVDADISVLHQAHFTVQAVGPNNSFKPRPLRGRGVVL